MPLRQTDLNQTAYIFTVIRINNIYVIIQGIGWRACPFIHLSSPRALFPSLIGNTFYLSSRCAYWKILSWQNQMKYIKNTYYVLQIARSLYIDYRNTWKKTEDTIIYSWYWINHWNVCFAQIYTIAVSFRLLFPGNTLSVIDLVTAIFG